MAEVVRQFNTGANRSKDENKPDYEGFLCPLVVEEYGQYMHSHRRLPDGSFRESDNWQKGIPLTAYAKSLVRHVFQFHRLHRGYPVNDWDTGKPVALKEMLCAIIFNASGYLHEVLKQEQKKSDAA